MESGSKYFILKGLNTMQYEVETLGQNKDTTLKLTT